MACASASTEPQHGLEVWTKTGTSSATFLDTVFLSLRIMCLVPLERGLSTRRTPYVDGFPEILTSCFGRVVRQ